MEIPGHADNWRLNLYCRTVLAKQILQISHDHCVSELCLNIG